MQNYRFLDEYGVLKLIQRSSNKAGQLMVMYTHLQLFTSNTLPCTPILVGWKSRLHIHRTYPDREWLL